MQRLVIITLVVVELVLLSLLTLKPAEAKLSDSPMYTWGFAHVGSNKVVCKKLAFHPEKWTPPASANQGTVKLHSTTAIVNDSYCANLAKPVVASNQSPQN